MEGVSFVEFLFVYGIIERNVDLVFGYINIEFNKIEILVEGWFLKIWEFVRV